MRITGYRTLTTIQEWGRPVGDANGVYSDGRVDVRIVLVDTDEGITGVGLGSTLELDSVFGALEGEDPRSTTALYDRMLRQRFKAGHAGAVFGTIGTLDTALWDIKAKAAGEPLWRQAMRARDIDKRHRLGRDIGQEQPCLDGRVKRVGVEIALSSALLLASGFVTKSVAQLRAVEPGFATTGVS